MSEEIEFGQPEKNEDKKQEQKAKNAPAKTKKNEVASMSKNQKLIFAAKNAFEKDNKYKMSWVQEANFAAQYLESNSYLAGCTPESIKNAVVNISLTGLSLNPVLKLAYLVPRTVNNERVCVLDISYMGMIKILTDAGAVKSVDANVVYSNDVFQYSQGTNPFIEFQRKLGDRGEPVGVYAIAYFRDGGSQFIIMDKSEIEAVRAISESYKKEETRKYSPWENWTDEMWKKTALKRLFKILPKSNFSDELIAALSVEHQNDISDAAEQPDKHAEIFSDYEEAEEIKD